jgi:hypothetical protein
MIFSFGRPSCELALCCVWALLLPTRLGFGCPFGQLALRSLWKPQVFSPPHLCRWLLRFCWLGAPLANSPWFWVPPSPTRLAFPLETPSFFPTAPLSLALSVLLVGRSSFQLALVLGAPWPTRLAFPLETPSFFPTAPLSLALSVLLVGRSSCQLALVLGAPFANSPCVPSGNPKFFPHRTSVASPFGFVGWALLLPTCLGFGCPLGQLALRSLWKPQVFPHRTSVAGSFGFVGWVLLLATRLGFGCPFRQLALRSLWKPQVFSPPHLCRWLLRFCWLGAPLANSPWFWVPLSPTRLAFSLETPSFFPTAPLSPPPSGFFGWALLLPTRLGFGHPFRKLALRSLWKPQVFSPPHLCRWLLRFCWLGAPLANSPWFWVPLSPTRLAFPLETPSFFPTAPLSLAPSVFWLGAPLANSPWFWVPLSPTHLAFPLETPSFFPTTPLSLAPSVLLVGRSSCQLALVLGAPFANSPCVASGNPKFFPHCTSVAGSFGFVGWALLLPTCLGFGRPFRQLAWRSSRNPKFFPHRTSVTSSFSFVGWALLLPTRLGFGCPFRQLAFAFPLETPSFFSTAPLSPGSFGFVGWALLLPTRLGFGHPFANSPCVPSGNPKFYPHRTSVAGSFGFVGWALLLPTRLGFGRPFANSPCVSSGNPKFFPQRTSVAAPFVFFWLGAPLADSPWFWVLLSQTRLWLPLETPRFFPTAPLSLALSVLLVGCSSCQLALVLGTPFANSPGVPSGNPKFFPHCTSVVGSFGFVGWALLLPTRLGFGCPFRQLALRSLWKPQVFSPPHLCRCPLRFFLVGRSSCQLAFVLGTPLANSPCVASGNPKFFPHAPLSLALSVLLVGHSSCQLALVLGAPFTHSPCVPSGNPKFFLHCTSVASSFRFCWLVAPLANSPWFWAPLSPTRLAFPLETPSFFPIAPLSPPPLVFFWLGAPLANSACL